MTIIHFPFLSFSRQDFEAAKIRKIGKMSASEIADLCAAAGILANKKGLCCARPSNCSPSASEIADLCAAAGVLANKRPLLRKAS
jgi:hypothetical protein